MEIRNTTIATAKPASGKTLWTGRIITYLCVLFLLFDSIAKIFRESHSVQGSIALGWPDQHIVTIGVILLISTILYIIPKTAVLGAILVTTYLGGAVSIMLRVEQPFIFPIIFGILVWAGLWFRDERLRALIPFSR